MGTSITFKRPDGKDASGYLANAARGNAPGVVVIQEWWGLQDQIKGLCDRFAVAGFDALAICHLGDRILGAPPFIHPFPGSERALTLAEVQEVQTRLTKAGFDTGGTDGRVGNDTMKAVKDYQTKMGLLPADGYGGLKVLARLRQGG